MEEEKKAKTAEAAEKKEPAKKAPAKKAEPAEAKKPSAAALKAALAQMTFRRMGSFPPLKGSQSLQACSFMYMMGNILKCD